MGELAVSIITSKIVRPKYQRYPITFVTPRRLCLAPSKYSKCYVKIIVWGWVGELAVSIITSKIVRPKYQRYPITFVTPRRLCLAPSKFSNCYVKIIV